MKRLFENNDLILMEAAIVEQLRRSKGIELHPTLVNAPLIYTMSEGDVLKSIYQDYIDIAVAADVPFLMCTPTWRTNQARVKASTINQTINGDAVRFMQKLRESNPAAKDTIKIGGMIGCKHDCYKPDEGLAADEAEDFHSWQVNYLAEAGTDFLIAATIPSVEEATGIAKAMAKTDIPYIISFVISRDGSVLDGRALDEAVERIDASTIQQPLGYMVNCAYPTFLCASQQPATLFKRLIGYQANASSLDHCDLDGADELEAESVSDWGDGMVDLNKNYGIKIMGGCCGTGNEHLRYIVNH